MSFLTKYLPKSLFSQTLVAVALGIFLGIFFGEDCAVLKPIGTIYIALTQVVLYPYLICALLSGFGQLAPNMANSLFKRGWMIFVLFLIVCFSVIIFAASAIPTSIGLEADLQKPISFNLIDILISHNIFASLSQSQIPAVIIFCLILAFMLQRATNTANLFQVLDLISKACIDFWRTLVKIAPFCIGASVAYFSGTIRLFELQESAIFLFLFFLSSSMLAFWLLPMMISNFVPLSYKEIFRELREAILIVATTSSVLGIPYVESMAAKFLDTNPQEKKTTNEIIKSTLTMSFAFGFGGSYFIYLFVIFAALYFNHPLQDMQKLLLPILTYFAGMGGHVAGVLYLIDWLQLPKNAATLYISIVPVIQPNLNIVNVMSVAFLTIVICSAYLNRLQIKWGALFINFILAALLLFGITQIRHWLPDPTQLIFQRLMNSKINPQITQGVDVKFVNNLDEPTLKPTANPQDSLFRIQKTDVLRVGYNPTLMPFSFFNNFQELVGYDVSYMYALANALHARLVFIPYTSAYLINDLQADAFDIAIGGLIVTEQSLRDVSFSQSYLKTFPAFIVPRTKENNFKTLDAIARIPNLKIGVLASPALISIIRGHFPSATIVPLEDSDIAFINALKNKTVDAVFWSKIRADAWILGHPEYVSVTPSGLSAPFLVGYMVQKQSPQFLNYLNYWMQLRQAEGFQQQVFNHWILVHPYLDTAPRWSIIRNVLHWES